jgi:hypothetical protein
MNPRNKRNPNTKLLINSISNITKEIPKPRPIKMMRRKFINRLKIFFIIYS